MSLVREKLIGIRNVANAAVFVGNVTIVNFLDKKIMDEPQVQHIKEHLLALAEEPDKDKILLDFTGVEYLGEVALGMLITFNKKIDRFNKRLIMYGICDDVLERFTICKLDKLFSIAPDEETALFQLTRQKESRLSIEDQRKMACASHLNRVDITTAMIAKAEVIEERGNPSGLRVTIEIPTGCMVNDWVRKQLEIE